jgi:hypothetical protein
MDFFEEKPLDLVNHIEKCRLCIAEAETNKEKVRITKEIRQLITELRLEVC